MTRKVIIGSRGSDLALWQANFFMDSLKKIGVDSEIRIITTKGDRIQHLSFDKIEGKGFFTKEIESALLRGEIDVAIHSHKDLETKMPSGLTIAGVSARANPSDVLLIHRNAIDRGQPLRFKQGAVVGTSSARRKSQILALRGDISIKDIRGNVPTRIDKLRKGNFDAILLAAAGIERLELDVSDLEQIVLDPKVFVPAPAQGVLAYQCRDYDNELIQIIQKLNHSETAKAIEIERSILSGFGGGCHIPIGVSAQPASKGFDVRVSYGDDWKHIPRRVRFHVSTTDEALQVFDQLRSKSLPKSVLITKDLEPNAHLLRACSSHGINVVTRSLIDVQFLDFNLPKGFDWIFFSSSNAVEALFNSHTPEEIEGKKLAVYGEATARQLSKYLDRIDYIPEPGQPAHVAADLKERVGNETVLFPVSTISLGTISDAFPKDQCIELETYRTIERTGIELPKTEAIIFYSPSNVRGYFSGQRVIDHNTKVVAIGNSTAKELERQGVKSIVADIPHEAELFALLCS